jgi:site-specific DNA recombinase
MRVVLYCRVSTEEQVRSDFSVAEQLHTLRDHASQKNLEVVGEVSDEGYSGADPDRPGLLRVMELAESGEIDAVVAVKRDRLFRSRLYRLLLERDLEELGVELVALNDTGHMIGDGVMDSFAEWEREEITRRTLSGKRQKAREGKIIAGRLPVYGFRYTPDRDHYEVDEAKMLAVRRLFELVASGVSVSATARALDAEGLPAPAGTRWQRPTIREAVFDDCYKPHTHAEIKEIASPEVAARLDPDQSYGIWFYDRREVIKTRRGKRVRKKPRSEWIAVPVPDAGVPLEIVERARKALEGNEKTSTRGRREWELSGGIIRCAECGCALISHGSKWDYHKKSGGVSTYRRYYYRCSTYRRLGRGAAGEAGCSMSKNLHAANTEARVWKAVRSATLDPEGLEAALSELEGARGRRSQGNPGRDTKRLSGILKRLREVEKRRSGLIELAADGLIAREELRARLGPLDEDLSRLKSEADLLAGEADREKGALRDARMVLRALKEATPGALDDLDAAGRREFYRDVELKVMAQKDGSLTMSWLVGLELGELRCQDEVTSTR